MKSKQPQGRAVLAIVMRETGRVVDGFGDEQGQHVLFRPWSSLEHRPGDSCRLSIRIRSVESKPGGTHAREPAVAAIERAKDAAS